MCADKGAEVKVGYLHIRFDRLTPHTVQQQPVSCILCCFEIDTFVGDFRCATRLPSEELLSEKVVAISLPAFGAQRQKVSFHSALTFINN